MKRFIKEWFTIGTSDLFGDILRISMTIAIISFILSKLI